MASKRSADNSVPAGSSSRKPGKVGAADDAVFRGYINKDLSEEEKSAYPAWAASSSYWEALQGFTDAGVNLSLKRERKSGGFLASGTQRNPESVDAGLCVTARARNAADALGRLLFILTLLSRSYRWEDDTPLSDPDRW
jgi:hypothetical protein